MPADTVVCQSGVVRARSWRLVLTVTKDRTLFLNDKRIAPGGLEGALRDAFRSRNDKTLYLKADAGLTYGAVVEIGRGPSSVAERRSNPEVAGSIPVVCTTDSSVG